jgi:hypothetical protein
MVLPIDVKEVFGCHRPPVKVRINDREWRSTPARYGDEYYRWSTAPPRRAPAWGRATRSRSNSSSTPRSGRSRWPTTWPPPSRRAARAAFDAMSLSHRREYVEWVEEAKRAETRERRIAQAVERIAAGRSQR